MAVQSLPSPGRFFRAFTLCAAALAVSAAAALAAPFAALVMDARTGEVLYANNADTRLHPASLTKMMTLYIAFEAIGRGEISLDSLVTVSAHAANEQPSKLGLKAGQKIKLRYLIRAAAIKSANDAATAIGEAIGGSEAGFARRMNRTAAALGMTRTTFKNANGLTEAGHLSTARDMSILGRRLFYDHPSYYNLFSRRSSDAGGRTVSNTNTRFLNSYRGADGIKTGYTVAAGFNLVASAERDGKRVIATVFGGTSTAARNAKVAELLDLGFRKSPSSVREKKPAAPAYADLEEAPQAVAPLAPAKGAAAKTIRVSGAPERSPRPLPRPLTAQPEVPDAMLAAMRNDIESALSEVQEEVAAEAEAVPAEEPKTAVAAPPPPRPGRDDSSDAAPLVAEATALAALPEEVAQAAPAEAAPPETPIELAEAAEVTEDMAEKIGAAAEVLATKTPADALAGLQPPAEALALSDALPREPAGEAGPLMAEALEIEGETLGFPQTAAPALSAAPEPELLEVAIAPEVFDAAPAEPVVVTRLSTSGGRQWGINVGTYNSRYEAEKVLLRTALMEIGTLDEALRKVAQSKKGYEANFLGMTEDLADLACRRLTARGVACSTLSPGA